MATPEKDPGKDNDKTVSKKDAPETGSGTENTKTNVETTVATTSGPTTVSTTSTSTTATPQVVEVEKKKGFGWGKCFLIGCGLLVVCCICTVIAALVAPNLILKTVLSGNKTPDASLTRLAVLMSTIRNIARCRACSKCLLLTPITWSLLR